MDFLLGFSRELNTLEAETKHCCYPIHYGPSLSQNESSRGYSSGEGLSPSILQVLGSTFNTMRRIKDLSVLYWKKYCHITRFCRNSFVLFWNPHPNTSSTDSQETPNIFYTVYSVCLSVTCWGLWGCWLSLRAAGVLFLKYKSDHGTALLWISACVKPNPTLSCAGQGSTWSPPALWDF